MRLSPEGRAFVQSVAKRIGLVDANRLADILIQAAKAEYERGFAAGRAEASKPT